VVVYQLAVQCKALSTKVLQVPTQTTEKWRWKIFPASREWINTTCLYALPLPVAVALTNCFLRAQRLCAPLLQIHPSWQHISRSRNTASLPGCMRKSLATPIKFQNITDSSTSRCIMQYNITVISPPFHLCTILSGGLITLVQAFCTLASCWNDFCLISVAKPTANSCFHNLDIAHSRQLENHMH